MLDKQRLENSSFLNEDYFEALLAEIREIRLSERKFYQKITDIYATSVDYNQNAQTTRAFFAKVQNKLHFATHGHTAAGQKANLKNTALCKTGFLNRILTAYCVRKRESSLFIR